MSEPKDPTDLALRLDAERGKQIDAVRDRVEGQLKEFFKGQLSLEHKMDIVSENQKGLKERFEEGVSKRLTSLDQKFDAFIVQWGAQQKENEHRDTAIADNKVVGETAHKKVDKLKDLLLIGVLLPIVSMLGLGLLTWTIVKFTHP